MGRETVNRRQSKLNICKQGKKDLHARHEIRSAQREGKAVVDAGNDGHGNFKTCAGGNGTQNVLKKRNTVQSFFSD